MADDIEAQRLDNLRNKEKLLAELNLSSGRLATGTTNAQATRRRGEGGVAKKRRVEVSQAPTRVSARIRGTGARPVYKEESDSIRDLVGGGGGRGKTRGKARGGEVARGIGKKEVVEVKLEPAVDVDTIREGWDKWEVVGAEPSRDEDGTFRFEDYPLFLPNKSPEEMMREGCFGGSYWRPLKSRRLGIVVEGDWEELPKEWIQGLEVGRFLTSPEYDPDINKYKVSCGQSIEEWEASGWIMHQYDVRGWFQWYCRFFRGRRCPDDDRQVSRWRKCVGESGRWKRMLLKAYVRQGVREVFDDGEDEEANDVSPVMHQTCHHWAYCITQGDVDEAWGRSR